MAHIKRDLSASLWNRASPKAVLISGARSVGKTTLLDRIVDRTEAIRYTGDHGADIERLSHLSDGDVRTLLFQSDTLVIEEAQRIPEIGLLLKRIVDVNATLPDPVRLFVTASASLDWAPGVKESTVGRVVDHELWPLSLAELAHAPEYGWTGVRRDLDLRIVYGMLPAAVAAPQKARDFLRNYVEGRLLMDLRMFGGIRLRMKLEELLYVLALHVGTEVSDDALARETGLNKMTVADYLALLEQCFIVKVCPSFARKLPNERRKGKKIYFFDNGVRNALLNRFEPLSAREDRAALWENFFYMERVKRHSLLRDDCRIHFWRTTGKKPRSLDFVEVEENAMRAFECRLTPKARAEVDTVFQEAYPECPVHIVTPAASLKKWAEAEPQTRPSNNANDPL